MKLVVHKEAGWGNELLPRLEQVHRPRLTINEERFGWVPGTIVSRCHRPDSGTDHTVLGTVISVKTSGNKATEVLVLWSEDPGVRKHSNPGAVDPRDHRKQF